MRIHQALFLSSSLFAAVALASTHETGQTNSALAGQGEDNDQNGQVQQQQQQSQVSASASVSGSTGHAEEGDSNDSTNSLTEGDKIARVVISSPDKKVSGSASLAWVADEGTHVTLEIAKGLEDATAQYKWHIHNNPVTGDCSTTGGHLDPTGATDDCDSSTPWLCQEGDLSGKHSPLNGSSDGSSAIAITDAYVRWEPAAFSVLGRSIVIHDAKGDPWACGNITSLLDDTATDNNEPSGKLSSYQTYPESNWPEPSQDNIGWTPSIQEAPQVSISVDDNGKRTVIVGRVSGDGDQTNSTAESKSMTEMPGSKSVAGGDMDDGKTVEPTTSLAGDGASEEGDASTSASESTESGPQQTDDSGAQALTAGVGLGMLTLLCMVAL